MEYFGRGDIDLFKNKTNAYGMPSTTPADYNTDEKALKKNGESLERIYGFNADVKEMNNDSNESSENNEKNLRNQNESDRNSSIPYLEKVSVSKWKLTNDVSIWKAINLYNLSKELKCPASTIRRYIFNRYILQGSLDKHARHTLKAWIKDHKYEQLQESELILLSNQLNINPIKTRRYLYLLNYKARDRGRRISDDDRKLLYKWSSQNKYDDITPSILKEIGKSVDASASHVRKFLYQLHRNPSMKLSTDEKRNIRSQLKVFLENWEEIIKGDQFNEEFSKENVYPVMNFDYKAWWIPIASKFISKNTGINEDLVRRYVQVHMHKTNTWIPSEIKEYISRWISSKNMTRNGCIQSKERFYDKHDAEILELSKTIFLPPTKIRSIIDSIFMSQEKLSEASKLHLREWAKSNDYHDLDSNTLRQLSEDLKCNERRIRHFVYNHFRRREKALQKKSHEMQPADST